MKNLTPHAIKVLSATGEVVEYPASGVLARVDSKSVLIGQIQGHSIYRTEYGSVHNVPDAGTERFIVSAMVLERLGGEYSGWAFAPKSDSTAIRNANGQIDHVVGLNTK